MDWFGLLLGWIPVEVWITILVLGTIAALYFLSPILIPIWNMMPTPVKVLFGGIVAALLAYAGGRYKGAKTERDEQARREAGAIKNREEVDHEVGNLSAKDTADRLARWNRRDE